MTDDVPTETEVVTPEQHIASPIHDARIVGRDVAGTVPVERSATETEPRYELAGGPFVCEHCAAVKFLSLRWSPYTLDQLLGSVNALFSEENMVRLANHKKAIIAIALIFFKSIFTTL